MSKKLNDDWMNPRPHQMFVAKKRKDGTYYLISRMRRIPVTGNVSYVERWDTWEEFDNKKSRDAELSRLRETTQWILRGDQVTYINGQPLPKSNPREFMDV